jgi:membrane protein YqaA with SNARE-associated domain
MTCLLCVALGVVGTLAVSFLLAVLAGRWLRHLNERNDAAWADLNEQDT